MTRTFDTGATRDSEDGKYDYEGFLSPQALRAFAEYMHEHRQMPDGTLRDSDNWQHGFPLDVYMKSMWRHFIELWTLHRANAPNDVRAKALAALWFNVQGYLHEIEKEV